MPLFEVGDDRVRIVPPARPGPDVFAAEVGAILDRHLDVVLGEPVLVVHNGRDGVRADLPAVVAMDARRSPVVVDAVARLDEQSLVASLRRAGVVARMTHRDVARLFHAQAPERFELAVQDFRDSVALASPGVPQPGMRVVLLCAEVTEEAAGAVQFWRSRGRLDVLRVGVVHAEDGRRLVSVETVEDVRSLVAVAAPVRATADGVVPLGATQALPIVAARTVHEPVPVIELEPDEHPVAVRTANPVLVAPRGMSAVVPGGSDASTAATPARGAPTATPSLLAAEPWRDASRGDQPRRDRPSPRLTTPVLLPPPPGPVQRPASVQPQRVDDGLLVGPPPAREHSVSALRTREDPGEPPTTRPYVAVPPPPAPPRRTSWSTTPVRATPPPSAAAAPSEGPASAHDGQAPVLSSPLADLATPPVAPTPATPEPHPLLSVLAEATSAPAKLIWNRQRRGQRLTAWLRADGLIALADGRLYADPSQAATGAAGAVGQVDGWRAWRFGEDGPTLQEAVVLVAGTDTVG